MVLCQLLVELGITKPNLKNHCVRQESASFDRGRERVKRTTQRARERGTDHAVRYDSREAAGWNLTGAAAH